MAVFIRRRFSERKSYANTVKSTIVPFEQPSQFAPDPLTEVIQHRAWERLRTAIQAEHWKHIRTTNSIGSVYATVRSRTRKTKGCLNRKTALSMVFKLMMSARKMWRRISGSNRLPEVSQGVEFKDGIKQTQNPPDDKRHQLLGIA